MSLRQGRLLLLATALALARPGSALALGDTDVKAEKCSIAAGGDAKGNTITCNFGLTPEQLKQVTDAAVIDPALINLNHAA